MHGWQFQECTLLLGGSLLNSTVLNSTTVLFDTITVGYTVIIFIVRALIVGTWVVECHPDQLGLAMSISDQLLAQITDHEYKITHNYTCKVQPQKYSHVMSWYMQDGSVKSHRKTNVSTSLRYLGVYHLFLGSLLRLKWPVASQVAQQVVSWVVYSWKNDDSQVHSAVVCLITRSYFDLLSWGSSVLGTLALGCICTTVYVRSVIPVYSVIGGCRGLHALINHNLITLSS